MNGTNYIPLIDKPTPTRKNRHWTMQEIAILMAKPENVSWDAYLNSTPLKHIVTKSQAQSQYVNWKRRHAFLTNK